MRVFLTGSTGFIGSKLALELLGAGHQVLGLTRTQTGAGQLTAAGATPHMGDIEDADSLRDGVAQCDAVIHTAFDHNFANFVANCQKDYRVIHVLGEALGRSDRPLLVTSSTTMGAAIPGQLATEAQFVADHPNPRVASELAARDLLLAGVNAGVVRLSQIHDTRKQGLVTELIGLALRTGVSAYVGDGRNRWSAAHISDTARLYRLAIEKSIPGARYHATAETGIEFREIAATLGRRLGVPAVSLPTDKAADHFGWLSAFVAKDMSASSTHTREALDWHPSGPGLIDDLTHLQLPGH